MSTTAAIWQVTRFAGARPAERDAIDQRIIREAVSGTSRIIDTQDEAGGYPNHAPVTLTLEVPETNRAAWLEKLARDVTFGAPKAKAVEPPAR